MPTWSRGDLPGAVNSCMRRWPEWNGTVSQRVCGRRVASRWPRRTPNSGSRPQPNDGARRSAGERAGLTTCSSTPACPGPTGWATGGKRLFGRRRSRCARCSQAVARERGQPTHELACLQAAAQWGDTSVAARARELADALSLPLANAVARHAESLPPMTARGCSRHPPTTGRSVTGRRPPTRRRRRRSRSLAMQQRRRDCTPRPSRRNWPRMRRPVHTGAAEP